MPARIEHEQRERERGESTQDGIPLREYGWRRAQDLAALVVLARDLRAIYGQSLAISWNKLSSVDLLARFCSFNLLHFASSHFPASPSLVLLPFLFSFVLFLNCANCSRSWPPFSILFPTCGSPTSCQHRPLFLASIFLLLLELKSPI